MMAERGNRCPVKDHQSWICRASRTESVIRYSTAADDLPSRVPSWGFGRFSSWPPSHQGVDRQPMTSMRTSSARCTSAS
jgi:hypothetical protein